MKKLLRLRYILTGGILIFLVVLGLELQDDYRKNGRFRTMQDPVEAAEKVDLTGLRNLQVAGGPILPFSDLKERFNHKEAIKIIVDGTMGKCGYVYGIPVCGYQGKKKASWKDMIWGVVYKGIIPIYPELEISESDEAKKYGFVYRGFSIGSKVASSDQTIDQFVAFFDTLPENAWVYFHCHHGKGRTSIMLVMADIMKNAPNVTLKDIVKRQYLLGSVNLFDTAPWTKGTYETKALKDRKEFIKSFYTFICQKKAGGIKRWSDWHRENQKETVSTMLSYGEKK